MYERQNTTVGNATEPNLIDVEDEIIEEQINLEMASFTRIVNGEDCPPGECPWQVETLSSTSLSTG